MTMPNSQPNSRPESTSPAAQPSSRFDKPIAAPYPGLRPFEPHESAIFFGRDEHVAEMLTVLEDHRFLAVVGPSGGGKSSLVLAGLLPALRRGELLTARSPDWRFVTLRPGDDPFGNLARAAQEFLETKTSSTDASDGNDTGSFHDGDAELTELLLRGSPRGFVQTLKDAAVPPPTNVLLLVDQFEEIFRFRAPEQAGTEAAAAKRRNDAAAFVQLLLATAKQNERPVHVLLTMRSDFLGDCDIFDGLPQAINAGQYLTPRLNWRQLEQAIVGPPALPQFGGVVDASVVQRITNDIGTQRDELPVVQHALFRAWLQSGDRSLNDGKRTLTIADYHDVGGIREALSREADRALEECRVLGLERIVERVFRALVQRGANGQRVRRPVTLGQLVDETGGELDELRSVVDAFRRPDRSFLVPAISAVPHLEANTRIDISHESLIRQWDSLSHWLLNEEESESRFRRLVEAERAHRLGEGDLLAEIELNRLQGWWDAEQPRQAWMNRYEAPQVGPGAEASFARVDRYFRASRDALEKERAEERR
ncbi:MAG TPA: hypothetical protein PLV92_03260, partial [Pirellulaceae bacterium]|nr:hypothetical protein [Pirellulaceae bacterium]